MSGTEDDSSIADELIHTKQTKRYFLDESKAHEQITCFNCGKKGHVKSECKEEKSCYICGSNNHEPLHCNAGVSCFNCYRPGHIRNDCPRDRSSSYCKRCDLDGHSELECQDIWKVYKRSNEQNYGKFQVYCFTCGEEGHCGDICDTHSFRRDRPKNTKGFSPLATYDALRRIGYKGRLLANYSLNDDRNRETYERPSGGGNSSSSGFIRRNQADSTAAPSMSYPAHATNMNNYNKGARSYASNGNHKRGFQKRGRVMEVVLSFHGRNAKVNLKNKPQEVYKALAGLTRVSEFALPYYDIKLESAQGKIVDLNIGAELRTDLQNGGSYGLRLFPEITDFTLPNDVATTSVLPTKDELIEPSFNNWKYTEDQYLLILEGMITSIPEYHSLKISDQDLKLFLVNIRRLYNENNPFHNFSHGFCVTQMMYSLLLKPESLITTFTAVERFALIISALGHDLDHPGLSNSFQIAVGSDLALTYNDKSPLENLHCSKLFYLLKESDLLRNMDKETFLYFRRIVIECISATDIGKQKDILSAAKSLHSSGSLELNNEDHKFVLFQLLMKAADVSVELRDVENSEKWVSLLFEEFFRQGSLEQKLDIPKTPNMMRSVNIPKEQVGFISFILLPVYQTLSLFVPEVGTCKFFLAF